MSFASPEFWIALLQIIGVNIVLSGDNAVVIALAARGLPEKLQARAVAWGSSAAVAMRIGLTIVAVELLRMPYLKLVGAVLLLWIAVKLLLPEEEATGQGTASSSLGSAVRTILLADLVMSLDNVIAVAAAAKGNTVLLIVVTCAAWCAPGSWSSRSPVFPARRTPSSASSSTTASSSR